MSVPSKREFDRNGCVTVAGLFAAEEVDVLRDHFMSLRRRGSYPHDVVGAQAAIRCVGTRGWHRCIAGTTRR